MQTDPGARTHRIRPAVPADAETLLALKRALDEETSFMLFEPGERPRTPEAVPDAATSVLLLAEEDGVLLGYVGAYGGEARRNRHEAHVVLGVRAAASGRGIGTALLRALDTWAAEHGVHRLELTVMAHNERAIALYRKCGYELEGTRRHSLRVEGRWVDELAMAKLLS
ncbi:MAG TPA: GNAT family protein [Gaiellaceae bacterium]|nr:GNAT family protein [Gaiellaceae bacterium]